MLLIGDGLNGKSTLLKMLIEMIGPRNTTHVTRQAMSNRRPIITTLNSSLVNIVLDGSKEFLKDSSTEKTLVSGEPIEIEMKYSNVPYSIQTNALFLEGLNSEPRTNDNSFGLHRRIVRYKFDKQYVRDVGYERRLCSPEYLSALLKLLLENWTTEDSPALAITSSAEKLQLEYAWANSPFLQFVDSLHTTNAIDTVLKINTPVELLVDTYKLWMTTSSRKVDDDSYIYHQLDSFVETGRKTIRINGKPNTIIVTGKQIERTGC